MRDPGRISAALAVLEATWRRYPDMRLGQLIIGANPKPGVDPFYVEDDDWIWALAHYGRGTE